MEPNETSALSTLLRASEQFFRDLESARDWSVEELDQLLRAGEPSLRPVL